MLQVTFRDVLPSVEVLAQISAAHGVMRALPDGRVSGEACLSVTLAQRAEPERVPHAVRIELIRPERATTLAITEAHSMSAALRSGLSLAQASRPPVREGARPALPATTSSAHEGAWAFGA